MEHVKRGKLRLKAGASLKVASSSSTERKKKKKSKHKKSDARSSNDDVDSRNDLPYGDNMDNDTDNRDDVIVSEMTPAQRRHEEHRKKREQADIEKAAGKTYRERVEELNQYLGSLTEHHDIPRVSAAGNG